jgi:hypothetical protein
LEIDINVPKSADFFVPFEKSKILLKALPFISTRALSKKIIYGPLILLLHGKRVLSVQTSSCNVFFARACPNRSLW